MLIDDNGSRRIFILEAAEGGKELSCRVGLVDPLGASEDVVYASMGFGMKSTFGQGQIHAGANDCPAQVMDEVDRRSLELLHDPYMGQCIIHLSIAASVIGVVKKHQISGLGRIFKDLAVFLYIAVNGFHIVFIAAFDDAPQGDLGRSKDGPHSPRTIGSEGFLIDNYSGFPHSPFGYIGYAHPIPLAEMTAPGINQAHPSGDVFEPCERM